MQFNYSRPIVPVTNYMAMFHGNYLSYLAEVGIVLIGTVIFSSCDLKDIPRPVTVCCVNFYV